jgi:alginate O-acetyltransferase complex protein AlgJ
MKAHKSFNIILIIFFSACIIAPLVFASKHSGGVSTAENRDLAVFPHFTTSDNKLNVHFLSEFESWFNDHLGFREKLVEGDSLLEYDVFGKLTKTDTIVGKDNWLYYTTPDIIHNYQNLDLPTQSQLDSWDNSIEKLNGYLKTKNIPFIYTLNLDKQTIYPENYPSSIKKTGAVSRTDLFINSLKDHPDLDSFTPLQQLLNAKFSGKVYYQNADNAHWNNTGSFIGYQIMMQHVKTYFPDIKIFSKDDMNIVGSKVSTKVYNSVTFTEDNNLYQLKCAPTAVETHGELDPLNLTYPDLNYTYENSNKNLPKLLIFGDSYCYNFQLPLIAESYSQVVFIHTENIDKFQSLVDYYKPDLVIYENVERMFGHDMDLMASAPVNVQPYSTYKDLPVENKPLLYIDTCNNQLLQSQNQLVISKEATLVNLTGWAVDPKAGTTAGDVFLKVGDKYYTGSYGITRTSVSAVYGNPQYTNSGFTFDVDAQDLLNAGECSLVVISKDKTYQYTPFVCKVSTK